MSTAAINLYAKNSDEEQLNCKVSQTFFLCLPFLEKDVNCPSKSEFADACFFCCLMTNFFVSQSGMNPPIMQDMFPAVDLFVFWPVDGGDFCSGPSGRGYHHG